MQHLLCTVAHPVMSATCPFLFHCEPSGGLNAIDGGPGTGQWPIGKGCECAVNIACII